MIFHVQLGIHARGRNRPRRDLRCGSSIVGIARIGIYEITARKYCVWMFAAHFCGLGSKIGSLPVIWRGAGVADAKCYAVSVSVVGDEMAVSLSTALSVLVASVVARLRNW